jgi:arabinose-5-phosphate isomerase
MDIVGRAREVFDIEIEALDRVRAGIGPAFEEAARLLLACLERKGKVVVTGVGKSLLVAQKISATFASTGATSVLLDPTQAMHGDLGILRREDALLALSYSGESDELNNLIPIVKRDGIPIVAMTGDAGSTLARHSDVVLSVTVPREACPFNMAPTSSTTVSMALGDALAMVLLDARGFRKEDYARLHPAGAIGRALLTRAADIMRHGDTLPRVDKDASVRDALVAMTRARAGAIGVTDGDNRLLGVFTDGDLRRHISDDPQFLSRPIREVMTRKPITVHADRLAAEVLTLFEKHHIDDVLVVDDDGRLVGAIDIQDLPKLKIL